MLILIVLVPSVLGVWTSEKVAGWWLFWGSLLTTLNNSFLVTGLLTKICFWVEILLVHNYVPNNWNLHCNNFCITLIITLIEEPESRATDLKQLLSFANKPFLRFFLSQLRIIFFPITNWQTLNWPIHCLLRVDNCCYWCCGCCCSFWCCCCCFWFYCC